MKCKWRTSCRLLIAATVRQDDSGDENTDDRETELTDCETEPVNESGSNVKSGSLLDLIMVDFLGLIITLIRSK